MSQLNKPCRATQVSCPNQSCIETRILAPRDKADGHLDAMTAPTCLVGAWGWPWGAHSPASAPVPTTPALCRVLGKEAECC